MCVWQVVHQTLCALVDLLKKFAAYCLQRKVHNIQCILVCHTSCLQCILFAKYQKGTQRCKFVRKEYWHETWEQKALRELF